MNTTISNAPMGMMDRLKAAGSVVLTGKVPNPLASEPKDRSRSALVQEWTKRCHEAETFWQPIYDRIAQEQEFAAGKQWPEDYQCKGDSLEPFVADRIQQMLNRNTASTYAKNPTPEAKQAERMLFTVWDESQESLAGARAILEGAQPILQQAAAARLAGVEIPPPPPELQQAIDIVEDYTQGMAEKAMKTKIAKTASLLIAQQWRSQSPEFLASMKQLVTQIFAARVGYVKVMYRRASATPGNFGETHPQPLQGGELPLPAESANLPVDQLAELRQRLEAMSEPGFDMDSPEAGEIKAIIQSMAESLNRESLQREPRTDGTEHDATEDEGMVYDFLGPTSVLIDPKCTCLREFVGAKWIAHKLVKPARWWEKTFDVNLRDSGAVAYTEDGCATSAEAAINDDKAEQLCGGWEIQDKETGLCYVVCDGVKDFLKEPYENEPKVARFWSIVPLTFNVQSVQKNDPKKDVTIYPRSHVRLAMPMQININTAGEGLREHRVAARPYKVGVKSKFEDNDLSKLNAPRSAHDCILLNNLNPGEKIDDFFQDGPVPDFHPELYATGPDDQALMLATGVQPANLGAQNPDETATGQSIAEGSRISVDNSNTGEIDFGLSTLAQMTFEMLIQEMDEEQVKRKVGRGAIWPRLSIEDVRNEIFLQIEAGSSGRPNQSQEINNFKILGPLLQELMVSSGKSLEPLIKDAARRLNDKVDVDDYLKPAQVQAPAQAVAPTQPTPIPSKEGNGGVGPLQPGISAANIPQPGQSAHAPPLPPVSRNQVAATVNGG